MLPTDDEHKIRIARILAIYDASLPSTVRPDNSQRLALLLLELRVYAEYHNIKWADLIESVEDNYERHVRRPATQRGARPE